MTIRFEEPVLGWRTLKDIYRHYLAQTPSEEGISAAEVIKCADNGIRMRERAVQVQTASGSISSEQAAQALASIKEDKDQAARMRAIAAHIMTRDAVAGLWFAIGRKDGKGKHQFIHPRDWNFLLLDIEKGAVSRDGLCFEDLRCAFTKDVPENHPIRAAIGTARIDGPGDDVTAIAAEEIVSPPIAPLATQDASRHDGPGRPSSFHLINNEFEQRIKQNALEPSLTKQAEALSAWFKSTHPGLRPYQPKTIANCLRKSYRAAMSPKKDPKL